MSSCCLPCTPLNARSTHRSNPLATDRSAPVGGRRRISADRRLQAGQRPGIRPQLPAPRELPAPSEGEAEGDSRVQAEWCFCSAWPSRSPSFPLPPFPSLPSRPPPLARKAPPGRSPREQSTRSPLPASASGAESSSGVQGVD